MYKFANQIIDAYDDIYFQTLEKLAKERPDTNLMSPEEKLVLGDDDYALTFITKEAQKLGKFPVNDKDNTWLSNKFFEENHYKLASEAQKVAATFIKKACEAFQVEPCEAVVKLAGEARHNVVYEAACREARTLEVPAPQTKYAEFADVSRICDNYTHAQYVFSTPDHVKAACQYFEEKHQKMPLDLRHKYAAAIQIRSEELGMGTQKGTIAKYASNSYNAKLAGHMASRRQLLGASPFAKELDKIAAAQSQYSPYQFAQVLAGFDKKAGLNQYYGGYLADPYQSTFSAPKEDSYKWMNKKGSRSLTAEEIEKVVGAHNSKIAEYIGKSAAEEMRKDPVAIFQSMPDDVKEIIGHIHDGSL